MSLEQDLSLFTCCDALPVWRRVPICPRCRTACLPLVSPPASFPFLPSSCTTPAVLVYAVRLVPRTC
eukprot:gene11066-7697_t